MKPDILIVRDGECYRVLHGLLHLTGALCLSREILLEVRGEGTVKVVKTAAGIRVRRKSQQLPLRLA